MKKLILVILLFIIVVLGSILWWTNGLSSANHSNKDSIVFVVQEGSGLKEIASKLETAGLIKNRIVFFLYTRLNKFEEKIQAGDFRLSPSMTAQEIADNLTHGTLDVWITVPEGKRATEIAEILQAKIPTYNSTWKKTLVMNEGYLFPDTYLIPRDANIEMVVDLMKNNFEQKYKLLNTSKTKLSKDEIVTLASIIEREARTEEDRPIVAGILLNRLENGMRLELCSTVQYALGYYSLQKTWWKNGLTFEDLKIASPYNTYRNDGMPLTPIANPGIAALAAVINPTKSNYLYWLSDATGQIHYSRTLQEHNQNIEKYGLN
ncbi:MAG: endolytic transglycosylase MltG [Candidatus Levybacteria bacterium]|nr:endolytic transglycosylase MltG [Candidatus Levybacteria bacterium]MDZ4228440.1 endolytic transglycosylase MltG [Candidatus Levybacteria bacterium]